MIALLEAQRRVFSRVGVGRPVSVSLADALHLVTAAAVVSGETVPPFDNSSVDGYALRAEETTAAPLRLRVVGELAAGVAPDRRIGPGEAIRIMTGAPIPPGATGVVMREDTDEAADSVLVKVEVRPGESIRRRGSDVLAGAVVIEPGTPLSPTHVGVLASIGHSEVEVHPRLRVGVLSTGNELVADGTPLAPGKIREANLDLLVGLVREADCEPVRLGVVGDDEETLGAALKDAMRRCDALITSGGVSMGDHDLVKVLLDKLGEMDWMQIAIRPAKPFAFGLLADIDKEVPVFGLPGNPVSSLVSFELLARPALRKMMGYRSFERPLVIGIADDGLRRPDGDGKQHFIRVSGTFWPDGRLHLVSTGAQGSHQLANSAGVNALAVVEDGPGIPPHGEVPVLLFI